MATIDAMKKGLNIGMSAAVQKAQSAPKAGQSTSQVKKPSASVADRVKSGLSRAGNPFTVRTNSWQYKPDGTRKTFDELSNAEVLTWISTLEKDKQQGAALDFETNYLKNPGSVRYDPYYTSYSNNDEARALFGVNTFDQKWIDANRQAYMPYIHFSGEKYTSPKAPGKYASEMEKAAYQYWLIANTYEQTTQAAENEYAQLREEIQEKAKIFRTSGESVTAQEILDGIDWGEYETLENLREASRAGNGRYLNRPVQVGDSSLTAMISAALRGEDVREARDYLWEESRYLLNGRGGAQAETQAAAEEEQDERAYNTSVNYDPYYGDVSNNEAAKALFGEETFDQEWIDANRAKYMKYIDFGGEDRKTPVKPGADASEMEKEAYQYWLIANTYEETTREGEKEIEKLREWMSKKADRYTAEEIVERIDWDDYPTLQNMREVADVGNARMLNRPVKAGDASILQMARELTGESGENVDVSDVNAPEPDAVVNASDNNQSAPDSEENSVSYWDMWKMLGQAMGDIVRVSREQQQEAIDISDGIPYNEFVGSLRSSMSLDAAIAFMKHQSSGLNFVASEEDREMYRQQLELLEMERDERQRIEERVRADADAAVGSNGERNIAEQIIDDLMQNLIISGAEKVPIQDYEAYLRNHMGPEAGQNPEMDKYDAPTAGEERAGLLALGIAEGFDRAATATTQGAEYVLYELKRRLPWNQGKTKEELYYTDRELAALKGWNQQFSRKWVEDSERERLAAEYPVFNQVSMGVSELIKMTGQTVGMPVPGMSASAGWYGMDLLKNGGKVARTMEGALGKAVHRMPFHLDVYAQTYETALEEGATEDQAGKAAAINAMASGYLSSKAVEGLGRLGGSVTRLFTSRIGKSAAQKGLTNVFKSGWGEALLAIGKAAISEGAEEAIEEPIQSGIAKMVYDQDRAWYGEGAVIDPQAMLESGVGGAIAGPMFTVAIGLSGALGETSRQKSEEILDRTARGELVPLDEIEELAEIEAREAEIQDAAEALTAQRQPEIEAAGQKAQAAMDAANAAQERAESAQAELNTRLEEARPVRKAIDEGTASYEDPEVQKEIMARGDAMKSAQEGVTKANTELASAQTKAAEAAQEAQGTIDRIRDEARTEATAQVDANIEAERQAEAQAAADQREAVRQEVMKQIAGPERPGAHALYQGTLDPDQTRQIQILDALGRQYKVEIDIVDTLGGANGMYAGGRHIVVALDALEGAYVQTAAHEMVHYIKKASPEGYAMLESTVAQYLIDNERYDFNEEVRKRMEEYRAQGFEADEEYAIEEIIAEAVPTIFTDGRVIQEIVDKNRTLAQKIRDYFYEFAQRLRQIALNYAAENKRLEVDAILASAEDNADVLFRIAEDFDSAMQMAGEADGTAEADKRYIPKNTAYPTGAEASVDAPEATGDTAPDSIMPDSEESSDIEPESFLKNTVYSTGTEAREAAEANRAQTETDEFKAWFEGSKVVNEDGSPKVMYHGSSRSGFNMFDTYGSNYGLMGMGSYFTENPEIADSYTHKGRGTTPGVYPVYLSIKNPIDMDAKADDALISAWNKDFSEYLAEGEIRPGMTNEEVLRVVEAGLSYESVPKWDAIEMLQGFYVSNGFDGVTHMGGGRVNPDGPRHRVFIAFDPTQVKSATANEGTFNPDDGDIRLSLNNAQLATGAIRGGETRELLGKTAGKTLREYRSGYDRAETTAGLSAMANAYTAGKEAEAVAAADELARKIIEESGEKKFSDMDEIGAAADLSLRLQSEVLGVINKPDRAKTALEDANALRDRYARENAERRRAASEERHRQFREAADRLFAAREAGDSEAEQAAVDEYRRLRSTSGRARLADAADAGIQIRKAGREIGRLDRLIAQLNETLTGEDMDVAANRGRLEEERDTYIELRDQLKRQQNALHRQAAIARAGMDAAQDLTEWEADRRMGEALDIDMAEHIDNLVVDMRERNQSLWARMRGKMKDFNMTSTIDVSDVEFFFEDVLPEMQMQNGMVKVWTDRLDAAKSQLEMEKKVQSQLRKRIDLAEEGDGVDVNALRVQESESRDRIDALESARKLAEAEAKYARRTGAESLQKALREGRLPQPIMERVMAIVKVSGRSGKFNSDDRVRAFIETERLSSTTVARVWDDIFGEFAPVMRAVYYDPVMDNETDRQTWMKNWREKIAALELTEKESYYVQLIGENKAPMELVNQVHLQYPKVFDAIEVFREFYAEAYDMAKAALVRNGYDMGKIDVYFPHMDVKKTFLEKLGVPVEHAALPTSIQGLTENFRPGKQYSAHILTREGDTTDYDAVYGFEEYIGAMSNVIFHTDDIQRIRQLESEIRAAGKHDLTWPEKNVHGESFFLNHFVGWLNEYGNLLAGKKSSLDRGLEKVAVGRVVYSLTNKLKSLKGANAVMGNLSSAITNFIPVQQVVSEHPMAALKAAAQLQMGNVIGKGNVPESQFMIRRFGSDSVVQTAYTKFSKIAGKPFELADQIGTKLVVATYYQANLDMGMDSETAMRSADAKAARLMGDRSKGAMPNIYGSQLISFFTQFQYEVANQSQHFRKDIWRGKGLGKGLIAVFMSALTGHLFNDLCEKITGRRPAADPIDMAMEAFNAWKDKGEPQMVVQSLYNSVSDMFPYIGMLGNGGRIAAFEGISDLFSAAFAGDGSWTYELKQTAMGFVPAGGQIKKSWRGALALARGGYYNSKGDKLYFPVDASNPMEAVQALIFGPTSIQAGVDYYAGDAPALTPTGTKAFQQDMERGMTATEAYRNEADRKKAEDLEDAANEEGKSKEIAEAKIRDNIEMTDEDRKAQAAAEEAQSQREEARALRETSVPGDLIGDRYWKMRDSEPVKAGIRIWQITGKSWALPHEYAAEDLFELDPDGDGEKKPYFLTQELADFANEYYEDEYMTIMKGIDPEKMDEEEMEELKKEIEDLKSDLDKDLKKMIEDERG